MARTSATSARRGVVAFLAVVALVSVAAACSSSSASTPFCRALNQGDLRFNGDYDQVVVAMDRVLAQLSPADRGDVRAVRDFVAAAAHPNEHPDDIKAELLTYADAIPRLDARLRRECGIGFGKAGFPFFDLRPTTTVGPGLNPTPLGARP